jgi:hypothetical protein
MLIKQDDLLLVRMNDLTYYLEKSPDGSYAKQTTGDIYVGLGKIIGSGKMAGANSRVSYQIDCKKSAFRTMYVTDGKEYSEWKRFKKKTVVANLAMRICD